MQKFNLTENFDLLHSAKNYVINLDKTFENLKIKNQNKGFLVTLLDLTIYVESNEEFHILNEVFVKKDYNFITNKKSIVIDIGANIGITSLYFSTLSYVDKIYSFEPVKYTFEQAQHNFSLNKNVHKIERIKNIGLGKNSRKESFLFDKYSKGSAGLRGDLSPRYSKNNKAEKVEVQISEATKEIGLILGEVKNRQVIVKMDCEGAEYEILENLFESGITKQIDVILLEWHDKGSILIEEMLKESGFSIFSISLGPISGMIYALKNS